MAQLSPQPGLGHKAGSSQGRGGGVQGGHHLTNCFATPKWARGSIWLGAPLLQEGLRERWCAGLRGAAVCRREGAGDASPLPSFFFFSFSLPLFHFYYLWAEGFALTLHRVWEHILRLSPLEYPGVSMPSSNLECPSSRLHPDPCPHQGQPCASGMTDEGQAVPWQLCSAFRDYSWNFAPEEQISSRMG